MPKNNNAGLPNPPHFNIIDSENECDSTVSVSEEKLVNKFSLYPNPTSEVLFVQSDLNNYKFIISDVYGHVIKEGILSQGLNEFDITLLNSGIWFLNVLDLNKRVYQTKKFIVHHN